MTDMILNDSNWSMIIIFVTNCNIIWIAYNNWIQFLRWTCVWLENFSITAWDIWVNRTGTIVGHDCVLKVLYKIRIFFDFCCDFMQKYYSIYIYTLCFSFIWKESLKFRIFKRMWEYTFQCWVKIITNIMKNINCRQIPLISAITVPNITKWLVYRNSFIHFVSMFQLIKSIFNWNETKVEKSRHIYLDSQHKVVSTLKQIT